MEKSTVLLFDIDNTLLDFSAGAMQAMEEIFRAAGLPYAPEMFAVFQVENDKLWARIERGELTIAGLRDVRWQTILARLGLEADGAAMEDAFRDRLHESAVPVAGAPEVLARLHGKYRLCAASNGPYAQQVNRLRRAGMRLSGCSSPGRWAQRSRAGYSLTGVLRSCPVFGRNSA